MASWDDSPAALGLTVERVLRNASSSSQELLPEGWILHLVDKGHSVDRLPSFLEAVLHAGMRVATSNTFATLPTVEAYLQDLHAQHGRAGSSKDGVCGYMFKNNDIAWNCRTCQMDDTCVLCQRCFQNSDHTGHEVFFHRTSPGGMCDCGDVEAWKPEGFCKDHTGAPSEASSEDGPVLPPAFERVFQCILRDFAGFITYVAQHSANSFDDFKVAEKGELTKRKHLAKTTPPTGAAIANPTIFHTRISNDDVHTDDELVRCLVEKEFTEAFAETFTRSVDQRGCGTLKANATLAEALNWMRQMKEAGNWFASVVDNYHIAHEVAWFKLYECLAPLLAVSPAVQTILFQHLFAPYAKENAANAYDVPARKAPLAVLLQATPFLKKELVKGMKQVYLAIMGSKQLKTQFAPIYVNVFPRLMMQYFGGMGTERENVFGLGVQIFTTPSIVHQLEDDMGLWDVVLTTLQDAMNLAKVPLDPVAPSSDAVTYSVKHMAIKYRRYFPLLQDINHLLMLPAMGVKFAQSHASLFLAVLNDASHMNLQTRVPEGRPHVEREDNAAWVAAFTLVMHMDSLVLPNLYKALRQQSAGVDAAVWALCDAFLAELATFASTAHLVYETDAGLGAPIVQYSVASQPVSFHYPLHQAWGRFLLEMIQRNLFQDLHTRLTDWRLVDALMEFPLRSLVWSSQIASNMWVRNGKDMMVRQVTSYYSLSSNHSFRDLDLVTVQSCLVLMGPTRFLAIFLARYDILPCLTAIAPNSTWLHKLSMEKRAMYVAECLLKLIWIATELPPVSALSIAGHLRRDVLHMILVKPRVFSHLRDQTNPVYCNPGLELTSDDTKNRELLTLLKEIADVQPTTAATHDMAPSKFTLKPQFYHEYDPAYFHVSPVHHVEAQVARQDVVFKTWTPEKDEHIPMVHGLQPGHPDLVVCRDVLMEDGVFRLLRLCLNDPLLQTDDNVYARILHILTLQLYMVQQDPAAWTGVVRDQLGRSPDDGELGEGDGAKRQKTNHSAMGPAVIHSHSIVARLAARTNQFKTQETIQKPLWSATLFVLKGYMTVMDGHETDVVAAYLATHVFPKQSDGAAASGAPAMDAKARLALQKKRQQEAMAKMMAQQSNFAAQLDSDDDELDDEDAAADLANKMSVIPPPECNICAHTKRADDPLVYVGLLQESTLRNRSTGLDRSHGQSLHVQLCRHAVHLSCLQEYTTTVRRDAFHGAHGQIAFDSQAGEFLCPLCKTLCNTCVPFVPSPPTLASNVERYFQHALDTDQVTAWLTTSLPEHMRRFFSEDSTAPAPGTTVMPPAIETFLDSARAIQDEFPGTLKPLDPVETLLDVVSNVFHLGQLQGLSAGFGFLDLDAAADHVPSLATRLASMFPSDAEALVDPFGPQDDAKLHAVFMTLTQLRDVFPVQSSPGKDRFGLDALFHLDTSSPASRDAYFLQKTLLEHDLFTVLLLVCSGMREKADMLWAIRVFCYVHLTQVLLQATQPLGVAPAVTEEDDELDVPAASPYAALRAQVVALSNTIAIAPTAPSGALLHYLVEANLNEFLRKATLLARAIFQGWNDPDAAQYLNFVSSLRMSTDTAQLCTQLGVAPPAALLDPTKFQALSGPVAHYISQVHMDHMPKLRFVVKEGAIWAAHVPIVRLAPLYTDLYTATASSLCSTTGLVQESPAICLLCGAVVCGGSECCKLPEFGNRGGCSRHSVTCSARNGAYFLTRQCQMLVVSSGGRSSFFASPYVDEFGEEDHMVRRGRPLFLRPKRYMALMQLVWSHGVATEVSKNRRTSEQFIRPYFY